MKMPETPPDINELYRRLKEEKPEILLQMFDFASPVDEQGNYRHWDKLKFLPLPEYANDHNIWWAFIKFSRKTQYRLLPFSGKEGIPFKYCLLDKFQQILHYLDQHASGNISIDSPIVNNKDNYLITSLLEEAITSSQLEGAVTTREVAKKMILDERTPKSESEWMIMNNYNAIKFVQSVKNEKMTPELICEIHKIISENTLKNPEKAGVFRSKEDKIFIMDDYNEVFFKPPNYDEISSRVSKLCDFANAENETAFIHPIIRSIILHFYCAYIHPFVDGNGRTARALFYWSMLKYNYKLAEFISISKVIKNAFSRYPLSYLYTETDENDMSYFIDYQLEVLKTAINDLNTYIRKKIAEIEDVEKLLRNTSLSDKLNLRQVAFLKKAIKNPGGYYSFKEYQNLFQISYQTSRTDLIQLAEKYNLLLPIKKSNTFAYFVPSDIIRRIKES